jgi:ribosomal protein S18 acetylase RimI-like enzyme
MTVQLINVNDELAITEVVALANTIWNEHFVAIIGQAQVDYMLAKFQSKSAITEQLKQGYEYYLLKDGHTVLGYMAIVKNETDKRVQLSKFYILKTHRAKGYGGEALRHLEQIVQDYKMSVIWLTVNKYNKNTLTSYQKMGFKQTDDWVSDIGNGYVMDDFVMEKHLDNRH